MFFLVLESLLAVVLKTIETIFPFPSSGCFKDNRDNFLFFLLAVVLKTIETIETIFSS